MKAISSKLKKIINSSRALEGALIVLFDKKDNISMSAKNLCGHDLIMLSKELKEQGMQMLKEETLMNKKEKASKKKV